jgi:hypothetical protein
MAATGKYLFRECDRLDRLEDFEIFLSPKKPWRERYWWMIAIISFFLGYIIAPILVEVVKAKYF